MRVGAELEAPVAALAVGACLLAIPLDVVLGPRDGPGAEVFLAGAEGSFDRAGVFGERAVPGRAVRGARGLRGPVAEVGDAELAAQRREGRVADERREALGDGRAAFVLAAGAVQDAVAEPSREDEGRGLVGARDGLAVELVFFALTIDDAVAEEVRRDLDRPAREAIAAAFVARGIDTQWRDS